jgi:hypothetical protein
MNRSTFESKSFLSLLTAPATLLPVGAGVSLLIVTWVLPNELLRLLGVACLLIGLGIAMTLSLFSGGDPKLAGLRKEFVAGLEAACAMETRGQPQEAKLTATAAPADSS